jgi:hypothetical protein
LFTTTKFPAYNVGSMLTDSIRIRADRVLMLMNKKREIREISKISLAILLIPPGRV